MPIAGGRALCGICRRLHRLKHRKREVVSTTTSMGLERCSPGWPDPSPSPFPRLSSRTVLRGAAIAYRVADRGWRSQGECHDAARGRPARYARTPQPTACGNRQKIKSNGCKPRISNCDPAMVLFKRELGAGTVPPGSGYAPGSAGPWALLSWRREGLLCHDPEKNLCGEKIYLKMANSGNFAKGKKPSSATRGSQEASARKNVSSDDRRD